MKCLVIICLVLNCLAITITQTGNLILTSQNYNTPTGITIIGNGFDLTMSHNSITNTPFILKGQNSVTIAINTLTGNSTMTFTNIIDLTIDSCVIYYTSNVLPRGVIFTISSVLNWNGITFKNNNLNINDALHPILFKLDAGTPGVLLSITDNNVNVQYSGDPFTRSESQVVPLESGYANLISSASTMTLFLIGLSNQVVTNVNIKNNHYLSTFTSTHSLFSSVIFNCDNFIHIHKYKSIATMDVSGNTVSGVSTLPPNMRGGLVFTGGDVTNNLRLLGGSLNKEYQYIAAAFKLNNVGINAYQTDVEIEPNSSDEYPLWNNDLCHYSCKGMDCDKCILSDPNQVPKEFSIYTHGNCYNKNVFESFSLSMRSCPHHKLVITGPYISNEVCIIASKNLINGSLSIWPRNSNLVTIKMGSAVTTDSYYQSVLSPTSAPSFFNNYHPFVIVSMDNNIYSAEIEFNRLILSMNQSTGVYNRGFFTTIVDSPSVTLKVNISFINTEISSRNLNFPTNIMQSSPFDIFDFVGGDPTFPVSFQPSVIVDQFKFVNCLIKDYGRVFRDAVWIRTLILLNTPFIRITDGWLKVKVSEVQIDTIRCLDCFPRTTTSENLDISGTFLDTNSYIKNINFDTTLYADGSNQLIAFNIYSFSNLLLQNFGTQVADPVSYGLFFQGLSNIPCITSMLSLMKSLSPNIKGIISDVACKAPFISCKGTACASVSTTIPLNCVVDKSISIFDPQYNIQYFGTIQSAIYTCKALSPRIFYIKTDIYIETLDIRAMYDNDEMVFQNNGGPVILIGANHIIKPIGASSKITVRGFVLFNPSSVETYTGAIDGSILSVASYASLDYFEIQDSIFIGYIPLSSIGIPTNIINWSGFQTAFLAVGAIHPNIRSPNHLVSLDLKVKGQTYIKNVEMYGSLKLGIKELKTTLNQATTMDNVIGYNQWGGFIRSENLGAMVFINNVCNYFCGGFSSSAQFSNVYIGMTPQSTQLIISNTLLISSQSPVGNPYVPLARVAFGNPYTGTYSSVLGYLSQFHVDSVLGNNYTTNSLLIRNNIASGFPIGMRLSNSFRPPLDLNDKNAVLFKDTREILREIQLSNLDVVSLTGTLYDMRSGTPNQDMSLDSNLFCIGICPPVDGNAYCQVGTGLSNATTNYMSINTALLLCPFNHILLADETWTEDIYYDLANVRANIPTTQLLIFSIVNTVLTGKHRFNTNCPDIGQTIPTSIKLSGISFQYMASGGDIVIEFTSFGCGLSSIELFENSYRFLNSAAVATFVSCSECVVDEFSFDNGNWFVDGATQSNGITFTPLGGTPVLKFFSQTVNQPFVNFISIINTNGFYIDSSTILCNNPTKACVFISGSSSITSEHQITNTIITGSNTIPGTNAGIRWDTHQRLTLDDITTITSKISGNTITGFSFVGIITSNNMMDYYPCIDKYLVNIQYLANNNTASFKGGIVHDWLLSNMQLTPLSEISVKTDCLICDNGCVAPVIQDALILGITFGLIVLGFVIFLVCCGGIDCLFNVSSWIGNRTDILQRRHMENIERGEGVKKQV